MVLITLPQKGCPVEKKKLLIVDDIPENLTILYKMLHDDYEIIGAMNGPDALKLAQSAMPDLILLDIMMPEMNGFEVCRILKEDATIKNIPVIFVTALDEEAEEVKGFSLGAVDYITKPFRPAILKRRVKTHLNIRQAEEEYQNLYNHAPVGYLSLEENGIILKHNQTFAVMLGDTGSILIGSAFASFMYSEDRDIFHARYGAFFNCPEEKNIDVRLNRADGSLLWVRLTGRRDVRCADYQESGEYLLLTMADINNEKQNEKAMIDNLQFVTTLLDTVPSPIYYKDASLRYLGCNRAYTQMTGLSSEHLRGKTFFDIADSSELAASYHAKDLDLLQNPGVQIFENRVQIAPGKFRDFEYNKSTFLDAAGNIAGLVCVKLDITERRQAEEEQIKFTTMVDCLGEGISIKDLDYKIQYQNRAITELFGDLTGTACYEVFGLSEPCLDCPTVKAFNEGQVHSACRDYQKKDGGIIHIESTASLLRDSRGEITGSVEIIRDISERIRNEQTIRDMAFHDPLTGLANRRLFVDRLEQAVAKSRRYGMKFGLLYLDLDHFKAINDSLGHEAGDLVLVEAAERIKTCCKRDIDAISRQGGDEFCIIIADCGDRELLTTIAEKLLVQLSQPILLTEAHVELTTSIGVSIYPDNGAVIKELEIAADRAMYAAKKAGRNTFRFWEPYQIPVLSEV